MILKQKLYLFIVNLSNIDYKRLKNGFIGYQIHNLSFIFVRVIWATITIF